MPRIRSYVLAITVAFVATTTGATVAWAAPVAPDEDLNNRGVELRRAGEDRAAAEVFKQAYEMTHSPRATAQLGLAYQALGRWELAVPLVAKALETPGDPWVKKYLEPLRSALAVIREHVARVDLTGEPAGAEVIINGSPVGTLPLASPVTVAIGAVDIQVKAVGYREETRKLNLGAHQVERVFVRLDKEVTPTAGAEGGGAAVEEISDGHATGAEADPKKAPVNASSSSEGMMSPGTRAALKWTSLGLGVAGIAGGVVATVIRQKHLTDFGQIYDGNCTNRMGEGVDRETGTHVQVCQDALDGYTGMRKWQIAGFVAGGVFTATWLVLQLTEGSTGGGTAVGALSCAPTVDRPGATCGWRF
jgi:hypothetical protein